MKDLHMVRAHAKQAYIDAKRTNEKAEVYEFRGRYFTSRDGEIFEMTESGMVRLCDHSEPHETALFYRPRFWFATPVFPNRSLDE